MQRFPPLRAQSGGAYSILGSIEPIIIGLVFWRLPKVAENWQRQCKLTPRKILKFEVLPSKEGHQCWHANLVGLYKTHICECDWMKLITWQTNTHFKLFVSGFGVFFRNSWTCKHCHAGINTNSTRLWTATMHFIFFLVGLLSYVTQRLARLVFQFWAMVAVLQAIAKTTIYSHDHFRRCQYSYLNKK